MLNNKTRVLRESKQSQEELKRAGILKMSVLAPGEMGDSQGNTHMFNEELSQSVLLLDTFFQFSQEKTKGEKRRKSHFLGRHLLSMMK